MNMIQGGARGIRRPALIAVVMVLALGLSACSDKGSSTGQQGSQPGAGDIAGLPVTHFESGLKPNAPKPDLQVRNEDGSEDDQLAIAAIADAQAYWTEVMPRDFGQPYEPLKSLLSYSAKTDDEETECGSVKKLVNAFYCPPGDLVAWDRGVLLPMLRERFGKMAGAVVLAHELGHAVQYRLGEKASIKKNTPSIVKEQQADCFAGGYFRWVAEDKSKFYRVSTSEGLNQVMASLFLIRDQAGTSATKQGAHGTAFDRTYAFQVGFEKGPKECAAMNEDNIKARITERPFDKGDKGKGDAKLDMKIIGILKESLDKAFVGAGVPGPEITEDGNGSCPGGPSTPPASYCPSNNTVSIDLAKLRELAQPVDQQEEWESGHSEGKGDFAAFSEIASRYAMGIQKGVGASTDNANAGLRTACLVGAWAKASTVPGATLRLSSGDLDEAISDLLSPESLVSADVNGKRVDNGFERIEALRKGYLESSAVCSTQYG
ncbi:aminopeptidase [Streptomyces sp. WAC 05977]|nr:aminopeptidase [Streptomyces sp. WAC 05977]